MTVVPPSVNSGSLSVTELASSVPPTVGWKTTSTYVRAFVFVRSPRSTVLTAPAGSRIDHVPRVNVTSGPLGSGVAGGGVGPVWTTDHVPRLNVAVTSPALANAPVTA